MLHTLHQALSHTRYALTGRVALALWGCALSLSPRSSQRRISIVCPADDRDIICSWAVTAGFQRRGGGFAVRVPRGSPGMRGRAEMWEVEVRTVGERVWWDLLETVDVGLHLDDDQDAGAAGHGSEQMSTRVLGLRGLVNVLAELWLRGWRQTAGAGTSSPDDADMTPEEIEKAFLWALQRMAERLEGMTAANSPCVVDPAFWAPFSMKYPEAEVLLARCRLIPPGREDERVGRLVPSQVGSPRGSICVVPIAINDHLMIHVETAEENAEAEGAQRRPGVGVLTDRYQEYNDSSLTLRRPRERARELSLRRETLRGEPFFMEREGLSPQYQGDCIPGGWI